MLTSNSPIWIHRQIESDFRIAAWLLALVVQESVRYATQNCHSMNLRCFATQCCVQKLNWGHV